MNQSNSGGISKGKWIQNPTFDIMFISGPAILCTLLVLSIPVIRDSSRALPAWAWVALVLAIDVAHVYSTLFRTYFDREELRSRPTLYTLTPILCWIGATVVFSFGDAIFWRLLAYIAVFHFVRQQYGFMMVYVHRESTPAKYSVVIDKLAIYASTLYPLIYWHTHLPREFHWFVPNDFISISLPFVEVVARYATIAILFAYCVKEASGPWLTKLGKHLLLWGTAFSWYVGIVASNGDVPFSLTNIISHGVPYIALIWLAGRKKWSRAEVRPWVAHFFQYRAIPLYLGLLLVFAYIEEGVWDVAMWRDHSSVFFNWFSLPKPSSRETLMFVVPLLVVPQLTHYVLDGFIWKLRKPDETVTALLRTAETDSAKEPVYVKNAA